MIFCEFFSLLIFFSNLIFHKNFPGIHVPSECQIVWIQIRPRGRDPLKITFANSEDPDEMQHNAAFHLGLHCL